MKRMILLLLSISVLSACALTDDKGHSDLDSQSEEDTEGSEIDIAGGFDRLLEDLKEQSQDNADGLLGGESNNTNESEGSFFDNIEFPGSDDTTDTSEAFGNASDEEHIEEIYNSIEGQRSEEYLVGQVEYCYDGDTCTIQITDTSQFSNSNSLSHGEGDSVSVRFIGMDTAEVTDDEPYSHEAKEQAESLLVGENVQLELDSGFYDHYDRMLAFIWLDNGQLVNALQLETGLAETMTIEPNTKYESEFRALERHAQEQNLNLWE